MKVTKYIFLVLLMTLLCINVNAQQRNALLLPDVTTQIGKAQLPISIENTDEIVGAQFDLMLPDKVTAELAGVMTNRGDGHIVTVKRLESGVYRVLIYSDQNRPLRGQSGVVMYLPINIPTSYEEGSEHALSITNAVLGKATGENVLTDVIAGKIHVSKLPDLTVKNITFDKQTLNPGDRFVVSWQVENIGELATNGGWSEQVSLISEDSSQSKLIATAHYDGILDASGIVSRQVEVTLPALLGIDGQTRLQVRIVPDSNTGESASSQGNNIQTANALLFINKVLTLELSPNRVVENSGVRIMLKLNRSGNWTEAETFTLTATADSRITVPASVTIPAGQSGAIVYISLTDNDVLDDESTVTVSAEGNGYAKVSQQLFIEDNEYPNLTVIASKSVITEGETFWLTITASRASSAPLTVTLTSENNKRFTFPQTLTIPAGESSTIVTVETVDDELPSLELSNAFTASAPSYNKGEVIVLLQDNDMPVLELTLTPNTVSEGVGPVAVAGVLRRTTNTNSKITVKLADDANGGLYFGNRTLELAKGVQEVHFNFGPVDNAQVDGDRIYTITAAVWLSSCSCNASGESAGYVTAKLNVLDNDGPALSLSSSLSTVKEGDVTTLTITRNTTDTTTPLTVNISSDYDEGLTYDHTVTIPIGQQYVEVNVASGTNGIQGDSHTVVFTVQAEGYSTGTCYVMVTDQTLPDAVITDLKIVENNIISGSEYVVSATITNNGFAVLPSQTLVSLYMEGFDGVIGQMFTQKKLAPGETEVIVKTFQSPLTIGDYNMHAIINESMVIEEIQYTNNSSKSVVLSILPPFTATVTVDKHSYLHDESIIIGGSINGKDVANQEVEIYIVNKGLRQSIMVKTNNSGEFVYTWKPYKQQNGHFGVGACVPGENKITEQTSFDIIGLSFKNNFTTIEITKGETYHGSIDISNYCATPLTDIQIIPLTLSNNIEFSSDPIQRIAANEDATINFSLKGLIESGGMDWLQLPLSVSCSEGGKDEHMLYYYIHTPQAKLESNINSIKTTMIKGKYKDYPIVVKNMGKANTGQITIDTEQATWISCVTAANLSSLEFGDSTTVVLRFTPTSEMELNNPLDGWMAINCENGEGCVIHLNVEPVSEDTGTLTFDICDDYTFNSPDKPHVKDAEVRVMHPITHELLATAYTNSEGICSFVLPEGYYYYELNKEHHHSYSNYIMVDAGREKKQTVTLLINTIQIDINYEETEIEDVYNITTTLIYETNVPTPVVILSMPDSIPVSTMRCGESMLLNAILTNKGLVKALDARLEFPVISGLKFKALQNEVMDIQPQQSVQIPIMVTRICSNEHGGEGSSSQSGLEQDIDNQEIPNMSDIPCYIPVYVFYGVPCDKKEEQGYSKLLGLKPCFSQELITSVITHQTDSPGSPSVSGGGGSGETRIRSGNLPILMPDCNTKYNNAYQYLAKFIECIVKGVFSSVPGVGQGMKIGFCLDDIEQCVRSHKTDIKCAQSLINCLFLNSNGEKSSLNKVTQIISLITSFFDCEEYLRQFKDSVNSVHGGEPLLAKRRISRSVAFPAYIDEYQTRLNKVSTALHGEVEYLQEIFGNANFLQTEPTQLVLLIDNICSAMNKNDGKTLVLSELMIYKPENISDEEFVLFVERMNNTTRMQKGETIASDNYIHDDLVDSAIQKISMVREYSSSLGFENISDMLDDLIRGVSDKYENESESVCAPVSIELSQQMTMTRQAVRGTLTIGNTNEEKAMTDIKLQFVLKDEKGNIATEKEFEISVESLKCFNGKKNLNSGWSLGPDEKGEATILFIPTKHAAPTIPINYTFCGTISYIDPNTDIVITRDFKPAILTVKPTPELDLTYFMQRDIYGDDPLTSDVVEPMVPAEFALIIDNKGYGEAKNVRMQTQQPKIIDNEKGLLIDFNIKSSQLNGEAASLSFGQTIANNFGTIPAHSQAYAQWWLESSLLGHFTSYEVEATHVTSYGNADLSLLDTVTIHEMIHGFTVKNDGDKPLRGYLVNDIVDADDMPDMLYFTDATQQGVYLVKEQPQITRRSDTEYVLTVKADNAGWNYGSVFDPTNGRQKLVKVIRGDSTEVNVDNVWQTDRTLRDGRDWLYENRLHFVGNMSADGETFYLTFEPKPELELAVESYAGVPEENTVLKEQLTAVTVKFNKPIKADSFTTDDISLNCQGEPQDLTKIVIDRLNEQEYKLTLNETTLLDGYYVLTVQTAGIEDTEGFNGATGKQVSWIQYVDGTVALKVTASPVEGGTVTPTSGRFAYDSDVTLKATPAEGYDFVGWKEGDATISTDREFAYHLVSATELKAQFSIKHYNVNIGYDPTQGTVEGAATGIYEHGTQLQLTAVPATDYEFDAWMIGDDRETQESSFILTVNRNMDVSALFKTKEDVPTDLQNIDGDALRINIEPLPLSSYMYITGNFKEIRNVFIYDIRGIKVLGDGNVQFGQGIYVGKLNKGIYYMQIATDRGVYRTKVLKK